MKNINKYRTKLIPYFSYVLLCMLFIIPFSETEAQSKQKKKQTYLDSLVSQKYKISMNEVDSMIMNETEIIDKIFLEEQTLSFPSPVWYGHNFSDSRVRVQNISLDSLPDEISITLIKKETEFCFPVKNSITSSYGWRERWNRPHRGIDICLKTGDPVQCCFDGIVRIARSMGAYGNLIVVRHYNGLETVYGHLSQIKVKPRQVVKAGTVLGLGGSTGRSTGPHLHFEVRFQYEAFDPEWILDFNNYALRTRKLYLDKTYFGITKPKNKREYASYKADKSIIQEEEYKNNVKKIEYREPRFHVAKKGDTWAKLSEKYQVSIRRLKRLNEPYENIIPGARVRVH